MNCVCEMASHDVLWWKMRALLSTVWYLAVHRPWFFDLQHCEDVCDALHDVSLALSSSGNRLSLQQCKVAWMNAMSHFRVEMFQTHCTLQRITSTEMAWKAHLAWHLGSASAAPSSSGGGEAFATECRLQSMTDKLAGRLGNGNGGLGNDRRRGGERVVSGSANGGAKTGDGKGWEASTAMVQLLLAMANQPTRKIGPSVQ